MSEEKKYSKPEYEMTIEEFEREVLGWEPDDEEDDEEDDEDAGCVACGNPNYPKCKTSCALFDNDY